MLSVALLVLLACTQYSNSLQPPHDAEIFSDAIQPVAYHLQRFTIDSRGQAYAAGGNTLYKIDSINDQLSEIFEFDAAILGFHITDGDLFIISTDNSHWRESVPCNIYVSDNYGKDFTRIKQIYGGCPVWMSISSDETHVYIGEYGPKKPNLSKTVWAYNPDSGEWRIVFQAELESEAHIHRVAVDPFTGNLWVTVGDSQKNRGVFLSKDKGASWTQVLDSQATAVAFLADRIFWGEDKKNYGGIFSSTTDGDRPVSVFNARAHGNFAGSIYELLVLPDGALLAPIMKYPENNNLASLWYSDGMDWQLLMIFESLPGQGKDTSSIAGPDKNGFILLTGYKINWRQL